MSLAVKTPRLTLRPPHAGDREALIRLAWGQGYGREAARAAVADAFTEAGLPDLTSGCRIGNHASRHILVGLGFELQGRGLFFSKGQGREMEIERFHLTQSRFAALQDRL